MATSAARVSIIDVFFRTWADEAQTTKAGLERLVHNGDGHERSWLWPVCCCKGTCWFFPYPMLY